MQEYGTDLRRLPMEAAERGIVLVTVLDDRAPGADRRLLRPGDGRPDPSGGPGRGRRHLYEDAYGHRPGRLRFAAGLLTREGQDTGEVLAGLRHGVVRGRREGDVRILCVSTALGALVAHIETG